MTKRPKRGQRKAEGKLVKEDVLLAEHQVPASFEVRLQASGPDKPLPLRLLTDFAFCWASPKTDSHIGIVALLQEKLSLTSSGKDCSDTFECTGSVLDPNIAAKSMLDAKRETYIKICTNEILEVVFDYSKDPSFWLVTPYAWYRLCAPAEAYLEQHRINQHHLHIGHTLVDRLQANSQATLDDAIKCIHDARLPCFRHLRGFAATRDAVKAVLRDSAALYVRQLVKLCGRHSKEVPLIQELANLAEYSWTETEFYSRPLIKLSRSLSSERPPHPQPKLEQRLSPNMHVRLLTVWDFCQSFRLLLRLPPFPISRLQAALQTAPLHDSQAHREDEIMLDAGAMSESDIKTNSDDASEIENSAKLNVPGLSQIPVWRDIHLAMLRVLEGIDVALLEYATMAGFGSAAEIGPSDVYRPLLSVTWVELVRDRLKHCLEDETHPAHGAVKRMQIVEYDSLSQEECLTILEALMYAVADSEIFTTHIQDDMPDTFSDLFSRGEPFGVDSSGACYYRLGGRTGMDRLYVDIAERGADENKASQLGWYEIDDLAPLIDWLDHGAEVDQDLAEEIYQAFCTQMHAESPEERSVFLLADGYFGAAPSPDALALLRPEILLILDGVRFWEKGVDWLQARAAVQCEVELAATGKEFARLICLTEELAYTDLLKGTGWGRKRNWCRDALEQCHTVAQAAVVVCQIAVHRRQTKELGLISLDEFKQALAEASQQPTFIPNKGKKAVLMTSGYSAHIQQANPPKETLSTALPKHWRFAETVQVKDVKFLQGSWQRPAGQGKSGSGPSPPNAVADDLLVACLLVERQPVPPEHSKDSCSDEIDWQKFSFQSGFKEQPLPGLAAVQQNSTDSQYPMQPPQIPHVPADSTAQQPELELKAEHPNDRQSEEAKNPLGLDYYVTGPTAQDRGVIAALEPSVRQTVAESMDTDDVANAKSSDAGKAIKDAETKDGSRIQEGGKVPIEGDCRDLPDQSVCEAGLTAKPSHPADESRESARSGNVQGALDPQAGLNVSFESNTVEEAGLQSTQASAQWGPSQTAKESNRLPNGSGIASSPTDIDVHPGASHSSLQDGALGAPNGENVDKSTETSIGSRVVAIPDLASAVERGQSSSGAGSALTNQAASHQSIMDILAAHSQRQAASHQRLAGLRQPLPGQQNSSQAPPDHLARGQVSRNQSGSQLGRSANDWRPNSGQQQVVQPAAQVSFKGSTRTRGQTNNMSSFSETSTNLRRSGRSRTEVSRADYNTMDEDAEAPNFSTRSRRGTSQDLVHLNQNGALASLQVQKPQTLAQYVSSAHDVHMDDELEKGIAVKFWKKDRDLAAVNFFIRKRGAASVEYLLTNELYSAGIQKSWKQGTIVKMPAFANLARAMAIPSMVWYTGTVMADYIPDPQLFNPGEERPRTPSDSHGHLQAVNRTTDDMVNPPAKEVSGLPHLEDSKACQTSKPLEKHCLGRQTDPWKALWIRWDPGTPLKWPNNVSPWEVMEDVGGATRLANSKGFYPIQTHSMQQGLVGPGYLALRQAASQPQQHLLPGSHLAFRPALTAPQLAAQQVMAAVQQAAAASQAANLSAKSPSGRPATFQSLMRQVVSSTPAQAHLSFQPSNASLRPGYHPSNPVASVGAAGPAETTPSLNHAASTSFLPATGSTAGPRLSSVPQVSIIRPKDPIQQQNGSISETGLRAQASGPPVLAFSPRPAAPPTSSGSGNSGEAASKLRKSSDIAK